MTSPEESSNQSLWVWLSPTQLTADDIMNSNSLQAQPPYGNNERENSGITIIDDNNNNNNNSSSLYCDGGGIQIPISDDPATLIHTSFAKVYTMLISPSPKTWVSVTKNAVPVSFYYDKQRNVYRILSYDGDNLAINSTIVPSMSFIKPSSSFGLWSDTKLRIIFGLGFANQAARDVAGEWFEKVVKAATNLDKSRSRTNISLPLPPPEAHGDIQQTCTIATATTTITNWIDKKYDEDFARARQLKDEDDDDDDEKLTQLHPQPPIKIGMTSSNRHHSTINDSFVEEYAPNTDRVAIAVGGVIREQSVRNLQHEEERDKKMTRLKKELSDLKLLYVNTQENLVKKLQEGEKLMHEVTKVKEQLQVQIDRADRAETLHKEEKSKSNALEVEILQLKSIIAQHTATITDVQEKKREIEQEVIMLRDKVRFNRLNVEEADQHLGDLENTSLEINSKVQHLLKISGNIRTSLNNTKL